MRVSPSIFSISLLLVMACGGSSPVAKWAAPRSTEGPSAQCSAGDASLCAQLMHQAEGEEEFLYYGLRACMHGDPSACEYLGNLFYMRSLAPVGQEKAHECEVQAQGMFQLGCQSDGWYSCVRMASTQPSDQVVGAKARQLTESACLQEGRERACQMLIESYQREGDVEKAKESAAQGCRALLATAAQADWKELRTDTVACATATSLGVADEALTPNPEGSRRPRVPTKTLEAKRTHGSPAIHPPHSVVQSMRSNGQKRTKAVFRLCLSAEGRVSDIHLVTSSGFPIYDRVLFESMQRWRYRPFLLDDQPTPVCTGITFVYVAR